MNPKVLLAAASAALAIPHSALAQAPPQRWLYDTGLAWQNAGTQPTIGYDNTAYFCCSDGALYAINPNGSLKWKFTEAGAQGYYPAITSQFGNHAPVHTGLKLFQVVRTFSG